MKTQNILIAHPSNDHELNVVKAFFKALNIKFEVTEDSTYDVEFINKIQQGDADFKAGKGRKVTTEELNKLWK